MDKMHDSINSSFDYPRHLSLSNPAEALIAHKLQNILTTRYDLLLRIKQVSSELANVVESAITERYSSSQIPPLGEAWPWVLSDLANVRAEYVYPVAQAWLAIYVYTSMLDKTCDDKNHRPDAQELLAGSLLFEIGLGDLWSITAGTIWADLVRTSVKDAIKYQLSDVLLSNCTDLIEKRRYCAGKNSGFIMCAAGFSNIAKNTPLALVNFTRSILLALQNLDDIGDLEDDYRNSIFTPLLCSCGSQLGFKGQVSTPRRDLIRILISSGALNATLVETRNILSNALKEVTKAYNTPHDSDAVIYFNSLDYALTNAISITELNTSKLRISNDSFDDKPILDEVEQHLQIIAQQS